VSLATDREIVGWVSANEPMLQEEYSRWVAQTHIEISFDKFCQQAFWQMPVTTQGGQR